MNSFALLSLFGAMIAFFLGSFVFAKDTRNSLNILFMLFCFSFTIIGLAEYCMRAADNYETAFFWARIATLVMFPISFLFHFSLIFSDKLNNLEKKIVLPMIYVPTIIFSLLALFSDIFEPGPVKKYWGWTYGAPEDSFILNLFYLWRFGLAILSIFIILRMYFKASDHNKAIQAKYISIGLIISSLLFIIFDYMELYSFQEENPEMGVLAFTISCGFIGYAMWKYDLFTLNLTSATENIILNLPDMLILINPKGEIKSVNQATLNMFKYQESELINKTVEILIKEEEIKLYLFQYRMLVNFEKTDDLSDIEINFMTKNGKVIPISLSASKIRDEFGVLQGIVLIGRDITERKHVELERKEIVKKQKLYIDEILKSSQFKSDFLSSMSHELRTPMNSIIGFSDLLLDQSYGELNENQLDFLNDIKSSSEHLLRIINHLLDISKIEAGKLKLKFDEINLNLLINEVRSTIKPLYTKKQLFFKIEGLVDNKFIHADIVRLKEIFYNLLSNAIKFTIKGGITLKIKETNSLWVFIISDTGIGIAEKDFEIVFKEFHRIDSPYVTNTPGTGLGLALTKRLVILHGGDISFSSKLGKGTIFKFTIPKKQDNNI
ncbi:MAG: ATP-binding protein [Promethearchaeota archaeon]